MFGWDREHNSSRAIAKGQDRKAVEKQVDELKRRGYVALMEVKEEIDFEGRTYYVCVMENPKLKAQRKNPSK